MSKTDLAGAAYDAASKAAWEMVRWCVDETVRAIEVGGYFEDMKAECLRDLKEQIAIVSKKADES